MAYACDDNFGKAIFHYKKSLALENDSTTRTNLAWVYYRGGYCSSAIQEALRALELPDETYSSGKHSHVQANEVAARCYEQQGQLPEALAHMEEARGLAKHYNHPTDDIDRLTYEVNKIASFNRKPEPTPHYGGVASGRYYWESDQRVFWVMYPGDCGRVRRQEDGEWNNLNQCRTIRSFYPVSIDETPPDQTFTSINAAEWLDDFADELKDDPSYVRVRRDQIQTNQGRTLEIIRSDFASFGGASVYAFYIHPDTGATFTILLGYATANRWLDSYEVDAALRSFTVLR